MTLESLEAMKECDHLVGTSLFNEQVAVFCASWKAAFEPLDWGRAYASPQAVSSPGQPGLGAISQRLKKPLSAGLHVGLVVDGHPGIFCFAADLLREYAGQGYACRSYAAIGALDQIVVALQPFVGAELDKGFSVYSVLSPGVEKIRFNPDLGTMLYNAGHLYKNSSKEFEAFFRNLVGQYGESHRIYLVECTPGQDNVRACPLGDLPAQLKLIGINLTLFIPKATSR